VAAERARAAERQQPDIGDSARLTAGDEGRDQSEVDRGGTLENVEVMSEDRRRQLAAKLASACCETALTLVYGDRSTQLREIGTDSKVHWSSLIA